MFVAKVDDDVIENVVGWTLPGGRTLLLDLSDGSTRGLTGWVDFIIERMPEKGAAK